MNACNRRNALALLTASLCAVPIAQAQGLSGGKPLRFVVPSTPGGNLDMVARILAERLQVSLQQPVLVENRAGGSSSIGTRFVGQSTADGNTLLVAANTFASTPAVMPAAGYDPVKEFTGVSMLARLSNILIVPLTSPYKSVAELIAGAKAKPGQFTYASAGSGTISHFAAERLADQMGLKLVQVPYKGNSDALNDVIGGRVDMFFDQLTTSAPLVKGGRVRALAVTSGARAASLPDVPTFAEAGVPNFEDYTWVGLIAPATVPRETIARLHGVIEKVLETAEVRKLLTSRGLEVAERQSPEEFTAFIRSEVDRLARLARASNIKTE